jgi:hypothetical protein
VTTASQLPAVIDYLVAACTASPSLGAASPPVAVFDGPMPPVATQALPLALWIGCDPMTVDAQTGDVVQSWPVFDKARTKDEDGTLTCAAQNWSGTANNKTVRDGAAGLVAAVELLLRGNGVTGPGDATMGNLVFWSGVDAARWYPRQIAGGVAMLVVFDITYRARLVTTTS